jgi:hypothetical protein
MLALLQVRLHTLATPSLAAYVQKTLLVVMFLGMVFNIWIALLLNGTVRLSPFFVFGK